MDSQKKLIIDFDNTLFKHHFPGIGPLLDGAKEGVLQLHQAGWDCVIYSCRNNPTVFRRVEDREKNISKVVEVLRKKGFPSMNIDDGTKGKPIGKWFIDDRGIVFKNNWPEVTKLLEQEKASDLLRQGRYTVSIGIEGCIVTESKEIISGSREALTRLMKKGFRILLSTKRSNRLLYDSEKNREKELKNLQDILKGERIPYDWFDDGSIGKPVAENYVETNMIPCKGNWDEIVAFVLKGDG